MTTNRTVQESSEKRVEALRAEMIESMAELFKRVDNETLCEIADYVQYKTIYLG